MKEYETVRVSIKDIKIDKENPNTMTEDMESRLGKSLKEFGYTQDVVVDKNTMILADGEHRLRQYMKSGMTVIPVKLVDFKNDAHRRAYRQAANKIRGIHDPSLDAEEYLKIMSGGEKDLLSMATGLSLSEVEQHLRRKNLLAKEENFNAEEEALKIKSPVSKPGTLWQMGNHRLLCGDCSKPGDMEVLLGDVKADMIFIDPPYGVGYEQGKFTGAQVKKRFDKIMNDQDGGEKLYEFLKMCGLLLVKHSKNAPIYCCSPSMYESLMILRALRDSGFHMQSQIVWVKNQFILGRSDYHWQHELLWYGFKKNPHFWCGDRTQSTIWTIKKDGSSTYEHPTQKPVELVQRAVENSSRPEDVVLDTFAGSGPTVTACERLGRSAFLMEADPVYCDVIVKRYEMFSEKKAEVVK